MRLALTVDAGYLQARDIPVHRTERLGSSVLIDLHEAGAPLGIRRSI